MTRWYSTAIICLRALATVECRPTVSLSHMAYTPLKRLMLAKAASQPSSGLATKSLHFYNIRPLNLQPLQQRPRPFTFALTREGLDYSIWKFEVASGLSQLRYEHIRYMVEDGLNTQIAAGSMSPDTLMAQGEGPLFDRTTGPASVDRTIERQKTCIRIVAMYDTDLGCEAPTECKLFFSYSVGKDPATAFSLLRQKNKRLLSLSKTVPIVDALRDVSDNTQ